MKRLCHARLKLARVCVWLWKQAPAIGLCVVVLVLSACTGQTESPKVSKKAAPTATPKTSGRGVGDTLRIQSPDAPTTLNPHLTTATKDLEPCRLVYEPLASYNKDGNLVPFLASEIPSRENGGLAADGKSVTWKLKQGIKWSDGQPFTADDVLFTYQYVSNPDVKSASASTYQAVSKVEVLDPYTVKVSFKDVTPAWGLPFVGFRGSIIPRHVFQTFNGSNASTAPANKLPIGTGPYQVLSPGIKPQEVLLLGSQLIETNKIVLEPNPNFRDPDKPYFSRVEWRGGGTASEAARLVLQGGQADYAYGLGNLSPDTLVQMSTNGEGRLVTDFGSKVERILLNRTDPNRETADGERSNVAFPHPFFNDKKVRQAFAYAINREAIAALYGPTGRPTGNNLVAPARYSSPNTFYNFDLSKAKALLDEAGWKDTDGDGIREKDGVKMKVVYQATVGPAVQETQQIVKEALQSIGVDVVLKITDSTILYAAGAANPDSEYRFNADMMEFSIRGTNPDPSAYMQHWTCARIPQKANNWTGLNVERWCSKQYDTLFQQANAELDPEKRTQLFIQMNDMLVEDVVMIPIVYLAEVQGADNSIEGLDITPWDRNPWNIQDWRRVSQ